MYWTSILCLKLYIHELFEEPLGLCMIIHILEMEELTFQGLTGQESHSYLMAQDCVTLEPVIFLSHSVKVVHFLTN